MKTFCIVLKKTCNWLLLKLVDAVSWWFESLPLMLDDARLLAIIVVVYWAAWLHQITIHISVIFVFWFIIQNNGRRSQMANNLWWLVLVLVSFDKTNGSMMMLLLLDDHTSADLTLVGPSNLAPPPPSPLSHWVLTTTHFDHRCGGLHFVLEGIRARWFCAEFVCNMRAVHFCLCHFFFEQLRTPIYEHENLPCLALAKFMRRIKAINFQL